MVIINQQLQLLLQAQQALKASCSAGQSGQITIAIMLQAILSLNPQQPQLATEISDSQKATLQVEALDFDTKNGWTPLSIPGLLLLLPCTC